MELQLPKHKNPLKTTILYLSQAGADPCRSFGQRAAA